MEMYRKMYRRRIIQGILVLVFLISISTAPGLAAEAEWPGWRGAHRDGKSPDIGLLKEWPPEGPQLLWKVDGLGSGFSSATVSNGMIYLTGDVNGELLLFAFDRDGKPKWKTRHDVAWTTNHPGSRSTPVVDGNRLYIISGDGLVGCYDAQTGGQKWTRQMRDWGGSVPKWGYAESVLIDENLAIVTPGGDHCIVALDKVTGQTMWTSSGFQAQAHYSSGIAFTHADTAMIVVGTGDGIRCVDASDGRLLWSNPWCAGNTANCPTPAVADGYVFWANGYGKGGICMQLTPGSASAREAWTTTEMNCHHGGYIIHQGYIYGNHGSGWACLDLTTGDKKWQDKAIGKGSISFADGMLYLFSESNGAIALASCSPDGLEIRGQFSVPGNGPSWAHPVIIGGRMYLRYDENLYCYSVSE